MSRMVTSIYHPACAGLRCRLGGLQIRQLSKSLRIGNHAEPLTSCTPRKKSDSVFGADSEAAETNISLATLEHAYTNAVANGVKEGGWHFLRILTVRV